MLSLLQLSNKIFIMLNESKAFPGKQDSLRKHIQIFTCKNIVETYNSLREACLEIQSLVPAGKVQWSSS